MTSQTSSEFLFNGLNMENISSDINLDLSSDIKLEEPSDKSMTSGKRKLEVKHEAYPIESISDELNTEPKRKRIRLDDNDNTLKVNSTSTTTTLPPPPLPPQQNQHTQYLLPIVPPSPQYFVPIVPHHLRHPHINPYNHHITPHSLPFHHPHMNINPSYIPHPHYNGYHSYRNQSDNNNNRKLENKNELIIKTKTNKRKRNSKRAMKSEEESDEIINNDLLGNDDNGCNSKNNNKLLTDKSPFKTTYISRDEETELKNTNNALYSQFHHARQAIYQQYKGKVEQIRVSNMLTQPKRKLQIKIAAIDAKVQEKKLFLSYLEMCKPQPNSWLISNSALSMNAFARKITHQQQTPASYSQNNTNKNSIEPLRMEEKQNQNNIHQNKCEEKKEITIQEAPKKPPSAKRVKKPKFSEYNVRVLRDWYETHTSNPYPSSSEKHLMCQLTGLTKYQVSRWFCNVRTRKPPPELSDNDEDIINNDNHKNIKSIIKNDRSHPTYNHPHLHSTHPTHPTHRTHPQTDYHYVHHPMHYHPHHHPHHLTHGISPINGHHLPPPPPITPIPIPTPNHHQHFNFAPMAIPNIIKQQNGNMIDSSNDNSEGLMPTINSNFNVQQSNTQNNNNNNNNTDLMPPPLIDENSNQT